MQFHIPQYIDIEDKLFGPLTLKQAIYVLGGGGGIYLMYRIIPSIFFAAPIMLGIAVLVHRDTRSGFQLYDGGKTLHMEKNDKRIYNGEGGAIPRRANAWYPIRPVRQTIERVV